MATGPLLILVTARSLRILLECFLVTACKQSLQRLCLYRCLSVHRWHAWRGHAWQGACMAGGMHGRGTCMAGRCAWQGGMHGRCVCVAGCVHGRGACVAKGCAWGGGMHGTHADTPADTCYSINLDWMYDEQECIPVGCILPACEHAQGAKTPWPMRDQDYHHVTGYGPGGG